MNSVNEISQLISKVKNFLHTSQWFMPLNYDEQKELFLLNKISNPLFVYPEIPKQELQVLLDKLEHMAKVQSDNELEQYYLARVVEELKCKLNMSLYRGSEQYFTAVQALYPCTFEDIYLVMAEKDSQNEPTPINRDITNADDIVNIIYRYLLDEYQISDWTVEKSSRTDFAVKIQPRFKKIYISINFAEYHPEATIAHEIDGHLVRAINMHTQSGYLGRQFPFYLKTEEGLASFLEDYCSENGPYSRKKHAAKYLAGRLAKTEGFRLVYEMLITYGLSKKLAFRRAFRLKRGISDTSKPGLFTKEAMYYEGMLEVKKYVDEGRDVNKLFAGKIGLQDIDKITEYKKPIIPKRLQRYKTYA